jgi:hydroxyacylglutathione hydrolase
MRRNYKVAWRLSTAQLLAGGRALGHHRGIDPTGLTFEQPMPDPELNVETVISAPFDQNAFVVWKRGSREAIVIDPGFDTRSIVEIFERNMLTPAAILNTHGHVDHIAGNGALKAMYPDVPLLIGRNEAALLNDPDANLSAPFGLPFVSPPADHLLDDGEQFEVAGLAFEVREIPGHSPGSVVFVLAQFDPTVVFGGDVLFAGSVGRTDLGGDFPRLASGIRARLYTLPDPTVVHTGHGPSTTVGAERRGNPFVRDKTAGA